MQCHSQYTILEYNLMQLKFMMNLPLQMVIVER